MTSNFKYDHSRVFVRQSRVFQALPDCQLIYWVSDDILSKFASARVLGSIASVPKGLTTADNDRYLRYNWEAPTMTGWRPYVKGGGYKKWHGFNWYAIRWDHNGARVKAFSNSVIRNEQFYEMRGSTYTEVANKSLGVRHLAEEELFDARSPGIFSNVEDNFLILAVLNSRVATFLFRCLSPNVLFDQAYAPNLPIAQIPPILRPAALLAWYLKRVIVSTDLLEREFAPIQWQGRVAYETMQVGAILHSLEGFLERVVFDAYQLMTSDEERIISETGMPSGWYPLIADYDLLPALPSKSSLPPVPQEVNDFFTQQERMCPSQAELARLKANLRALYEAGPGAKDVDQDEGDSSGDEDEESEGGGAHIPIPTETFLEELSVKLQIHPISVYWLLEELRAEGIRCKPEERRRLEDRLSVLMLRLLGHRWPKQLEAGEPVPEWADRDGIIPLTLGGDAPLVERLRERLHAEDGDIGAQRTEALLVELTGAANLDDWLRRFFWPRHVKQFKSRPIAWHLASRPVKGKAKSARPLFECLLYYHATGGDALARLRTQYVEPLLRAEEAALTQARTANNVEAAATIAPRVQELQDFVSRLREVEREGFASPDLDKLLTNEPLDRWSGDGLTPPANRDDLLRAERAWRVDLNDGVRVNIAPLQLAGLLASDVLKTADAKKAIADRARWRADERRWVREGKLPRCGWMPDSVPESPEWTRRAPERRAEQEKLEQKRQVAVRRLEGVA